MYRIVSFAGSPAQEKACGIHAMNRKIYVAKNTEKNKQRGKDTERAFLCDIERIMIL
jgi:hypothetical protein